MHSEDRAISPEQDCGKGSTKGVPAFWWFLSGHLYWVGLYWRSGGRRLRAVM